MDTLSEQLVRRLYPALAAGDRDEVDQLVDPNFVAHTPEGLPLGMGGEHRGLDAAWNNFWMPIGRSYAIRAEPEQWIGCDGRCLLVLGTYRGSARKTGAALEAAFAHLWEAGDERLVSLWHLTDSALWWAAIEVEEDG